MILGLRKKDKFYALSFVALALWPFAFARLGVANDLDRSLSNVVVISDVDDTIRYSQIGNSFRTILNYMSSTLAFDGMPQLYQQLASHGARIEYVTALIAQRKGYAEDFIRDSQFPPGGLWMRSTENDSKGRSKEAKQERRVQHKLSVIREIMRARPQAQVIMIGDDGQDDPAIYKQIQADSEFGSRIKSIYIHQLFKNSLPSGEIPFYTAGDLSLRMSREGLVTRDFALKSLQASESGLHDVSRRQRLTFPGFAKVSPETVRFYFDSLIETETDPDLQRELRGLKNDLTTRLRKNSPQALSDCIKSGIERNEMPH